MFRFLKIGVSIKPNCSVKVCIKNLSILNRNSPRNTLLRFPNYLTNNLRWLKLTLAVSNQDKDLTSKWATATQRYTSEGILNILNTLNSETLKDNTDLLLLQSCGRELVNQSFLARSKLCDQVWKKLEENKVNFSIDHYNIYLQNCVDNRMKINFRTFLANMRCKPNRDTFRLLLECSCENGDSGQAAEILQEMKNRNYTADNELFNTLLMGYAANGGLKKAQEVLETMRGAQLEMTSETHFRLLKGLALYNNKEEFFTCIRMFNVRLEDHNYIDLFLTMGFKGNYCWLEKVLEDKPLPMSNQHIQQLNLLCKQLVHVKQSEAAFFFYKLFVKPLEHDEGEYAFFILEEMLFSETPVEKIITLIDHLRTSKLNVLALEKLTHVALQMNYTDVAWMLLKKFTLLRPHYFWPILIQTGKTQGEIGIFSTLKKMLEWEVRPDCETLEVYCIPLCDSNNYKDLYTRIKGLGFTNRELLPPFLKFLLKQKDVAACLEICKNNEVSGVSVEQFLQPLVRIWIYTKNNENISEILQYISKMSNTELDYAGIFLSKTLRSCQTLLNHQHFLHLLQVMENKNMRISSTSAEALLNILKNSKHQYPLTADIKSAVDTITHASMNEGHTPIPHPRDMNLQELEFHLNELRHKNMETRGVLRRLIPHYCNLGNEQRVKELREQFFDAGYTETLGMKSSLMYLYILKENPVESVNVYKELQNSRFLLDEFKIIDLVTLLVKNNQFDVAFKILVNETSKRKVKGGPSLMRNCRQLLEAANDELNMQKLFQFLVTNGYCKVSNVILGPMVKFHIHKNDLEKAVEIFKDCVNKYNCTPQQLELMCQVTKAHDRKLVGEVHNCLVQVHGSNSALMSLIAALAQNGSIAAVRKILVECKPGLNPLLKIRCDRWVEENKLEPLEVLAKAAFQLPSTVVDTGIIYNCIMKLHSNFNDCESAVKFYRNLVEQDEAVPENVLNELLQLTSRCKYKMPEFSLKTVT